MEYSTLFSEINDEYFLDLVPWINKIKFTK